MHLYVPQPEPLHRLPLLLPGSPAFERAMSCKPVTPWSPGGAAARRFVESGAGGGETGLDIPTPTAFWRMEETGANNRVDSTGSGNDLVPANEPGNGTGKIGNCCHFTAYNQKLNLTDNANMSVGNADFTLAVWIKVNQSHIIGWNSAPGGKDANAYNTCEYGFFLDPNVPVGKPGFHINNNGGTVEADSQVPDATWTLLTGTYDAANDLLGITINNGTRKTVSYSAGTYDGAYTFSIPGNWVVTDPYIPVTDVDAVGWWKGTCLSADQVNTLYNGGAGTEYYDGYWHP